MKEILYREIPTPEIKKVRYWLQQKWNPSQGKKIITSSGILLNFVNNTSTQDPTIPESKLSIFLWSVQNTTYLKVFRWGNPPQGENKIIQQLKTSIQQNFPPQYPSPPDIDLSKQSIFEALAPYYPKTVHFFQQMPKGEYDLNRVYWWEKSWRESVLNPKKPKQVIFSSQEKKAKSFDYDLIYLGGALGIIHGAVMAQRGYRVLLIERLKFGRMNREWNISRGEFQTLMDLGLFTQAEFESMIANEYRDGFNKFFDSNNPNHLKAAILHTPKVLNIALDSEKILSLAGEKFLKAGGEIWDETEFMNAFVSSEGITLEVLNLKNQEKTLVGGRLAIDAMGSASPIAWQLNGMRAFDSVCPTVGATISSGFPHGVWDVNYGDVLNSHGDISRGRQLIWELFPGENNELTIYLFHYHQVHPHNPGSLLEMYEDFFTILPEYRRCDMSKLVWKKATFGYIPAHFTTSNNDRVVAYDRILAIGDAASLQSPLVFTGFGSLVRNLQRLTETLDIALKHDLLSGQDLNQIRAYQSNIAVTWLFSKGMMVPTYKTLPPERINAMLNTFFGILASEPEKVADTFIKDKTDWLTFNRLAIIAANQNPALIPWIWEMAGSKDMLRWLGSYLAFTKDALVNLLLKKWFHQWLKNSQSWMEKRYPRLWLRLLSFSYGLKINNSVID